MIILQKMPFKWRYYLSFICSKWDIVNWIFANYWNVIKLFFNFFMKQATTLYVSCCLFFLRQDRDQISRMKGFETSLGFRSNVCSLYQRHNCFAKSLDDFSKKSLKSNLFFFIFCFKILKQLFMLRMPQYIQTNKT